MAEEDAIRSLLLRSEFVVEIPLEAWHAFNVYLTDNRDRSYAVDELVALCRSSLLKHLYQKLLFCKLNYHLSLLLATVLRNLPSQLRSYDFVRLHLRVAAPLSAAEYIRVISTAITSLPQPQRVALLCDTEVTASLIAIATNDITLLREVIDAVVKGGTNVLEIVPAVVALDNSSSAYVLFFALYCVCVLWFRVGENVLPTVSVYSGRRQRGQCTGGGAAVSEHTAWRTGMPGPGRCASAALPRTCACSSTRTNNNYCYIAAQCHGEVAAR